METLNKIQQELKAPKRQKNSFGNYMYRSCEDILEAVKPLLGEMTLILDDEIVMIGNRYYVKAKAELSIGKELIATATAYAREEETKKGMDASQITGSASSYARKYALNGMFCIDDTKDADTQDNSKEEVKSIQKETKPLVDPLKAWKDALNKMTTKEEISAFTAKVLGHDKLSQNAKDTLQLLATNKYSTIK